QAQSNVALKSEGSSFADAQRDGARQRVAREQNAAAVPAPSAGAESAAAYSVTDSSNRVTVRGKVTDAGTGAGIGNAQVVVEGSSVGALTNESGAFNLPAVPSGQRTLRVQRLGYGVEQRQVEAPAGDTVALDVQMHPTAVAMDAVVVTSSAAPARSAIEGLTLVSRTTELADGREIETSVYDYRAGIQVMLRVATPIAAGPQEQRRPMGRAARPRDQQRRVEEQPVAAPVSPSLQRREPIVERAGIRTLRWIDADGSEFTLSGAVTEREMRALRERIP
ncbi:MAG: carboxypeptidase-like regulatory domain-containing protein, partial [Gemmatimonadaceae bacterium]